MSFDVRVVVNVIRASPLVPKKKIYNAKYRVYASCIKIYFNIQGFFKEKIHIPLVYGNQKVDPD
jgi:hypothetical protein